MTNDEMIVTLRALYWYWEKESNKMNADMEELGLIQGIREDLSKELKKRAYIE